MRIPAEIRTDDGKRKAKFDAEPWFSQASETEIQDLIDIGFRGDYPADNVAWWTRDRDTRVDRVLSYVEDTGQGFEVVIDPDKAEAWLARKLSKKVSI